MSDQIPSGQRTVNQERISEIRAGEFMDLLDNFIAECIIDNSSHASLKLRLRIYAFMRDNIEWRFTKE